MMMHQGQMWLLLWIMIKTARIKRKEMIALIAYLKTNKVIVDSRNHQYLMMSQDSQTSLIKTN
jgi:hypothetical protein